MTRMTRMTSKKRKQEIFEDAVLFAFTLGLWAHIFLELIQLL